MGLLRWMKIFIILRDYRLTDFTVRFLRHPPFMNSSVPSVFQVLILILFAFIGGQSPSRLRYTRTLHVFTDRT